MSVHQSIIVYRNPMEAAFWESGIVFPMIVSLVVMFVVAFIMMKVIEYFEIRKYHILLLFGPPTLAAWIVLYNMSL